MKVMLVMKTETYKDEAKRKKYYEIDNTVWKEKHEGIKYKELGGWGTQPGKVTFLFEYESMEEFTKIWSDMEIQAFLVKYRNLVKDFEVEIWRPTVSVRPK
jgi:hypothetical protein